MRSRPRLPFLALALAALTACGDSAAAVEPSSGEAAPFAATASDFSVYDLEAPWRDATGRERTLASLSGKVQVLAMVYTHCTHTCPMIVAEIKRLEAALPAEARDRVGFVLVSLDPARDTPERLAEAAASMRLDPARWTLLTGDADSVRELAALLGIRYRDEADGQISHSNTYLILDPAGRIAHRHDGLGQGTAAALARIREVAAAR